MNIAKRALRKILRITLRGLNIDKEYSILIKQEKHRVNLLDKLNIELVLDVGANVGQYTYELFSKGFAGRVISFEPVSDMYKKLLVKSKSNDNWLVYEQCAVGEKEGEVEINVSKNFESSSIFNVLERSIVAEPLTEFIKKENVKVIKLSDIPEIKDYNKIHLKIDVQGYEEMVLKGAVEIFNKVSSLELEISLVPLYDGALLPEVLITKLKEYGFSPVFYTSAFNNASTGAIMQLDGFFIKNEYLDLVDDE